MKKIIIGLCLLSHSVFALESKNLVCKLSGPADLDVNLKLNDNSDSIEVIVYAMNGNDSWKYSNTNLKKNEIVNALNNFGFETIVSQSNMKNELGGTYLNAGLIKIKKSKIANRYDVVFAAKDMVFNADCGE